MHTLDSLPEEILDQILRQLQLNDYLQLWQCQNKRIQRAITSLLTRHERRHTSFIPLMTNQMDERFRRRCVYLLDAVNRHRVSDNWKSGSFEEVVWSRGQSRSMPHVVLDRNELWLSQRNTLRHFRRDARAVPCRLDNRDRYNDICSFVTYATTHMCVCFEYTPFSVYKITRQRNAVHMRKVFQMSAAAHVSHVTDNALAVYVPSAMGAEVQVWTSLDTLIEYAVAPVCSVTFPDKAPKVRAMEFAPSGNLLAVGSNAVLGVAGKKPLSVFDVSAGEALGNYGDGLHYDEGILGVTWMTDTVLLTCGYNAEVQLWDLRAAEKCARKWLDPHYSVLYCIKSDNLYGVLCGTQDHGKTVLWDIRMKYYVQCYFASTRYGNSPVYSIDCDNRSLFTASDCCLHEFNFTGMNAEQNFKVFGAWKDFSPINEYARDARFDS